MDQKWGGAPDGVMTYVQSYGSLLQIEGQAGRLSACRNKGLAALGGDEHSVGGSGCPWVGDVSGMPPTQHEVGGATYATEVVYLPSDKGTRFDLTLIAWKQPC